MTIADEVYEIAKRFLHKVKKSGPDNIMALCPFHDNKNTPSFTMSLSLGLYHCFSCHESGNLQMFLKNIGLAWNVIDRQYKDVIEETRRRIPRKEQDPFRVRPGEENTEIPEYLLGIFDRVVPDKWAIEEGLDPGLVKKLDIGVDLDHQRITFPLREINGKLVGISGRDFTNQSPAKYKVYDNEYVKWGFEKHQTYKNQLLWNAHQVYPHLYYQTAPIITVEGFKACAKVIQAGAWNTVAVMGNKASWRQRNLLQRMGSEVWLWFDNHLPGIRGTVLTGMEIGLPVRVVPYPDGRQQPSDLTDQEILLALQGSQDFTRWLLEDDMRMEIYQEKRRSRQLKQEQQ